MSKTKIVIDGDGTLYIRRGSEMKLQKCLHSLNYCGDWCPAFRVGTCIEGSSVVTGCCWAQVAGPGEFMDRRA